MKLDRLIIAISAYPVHSTSPLGGGRFPSAYCHDVWCGKKWCGYPMVKYVWRYIYSFWHNPRTWQTHTHRRTDIMQTVAAWRLRPRLHSIERQKSVKSLSIVRRKLTRDKKSTVRGKTFHMFTTYSPKYSTSRIVRTTYDRRNNVGKHRILCS